MFYNNQTEEEKNNYKNMLSIIGSLSNLFSDSKSPMLYYRAHENCFCKYFNANNLARHDCSADASKNGFGIGLKTWVGSNNQKVAEFGKLKKELDKLTDDELIIKVAEYRNSRISTTMKMYGLNKMIYHVIIRTENKMSIDECPFDFIDIPNIKRLKNKDGENTRYFTDGKNTYNFNKAKTTLYMVFDNLIHLDEIPVSILDDPFEALEVNFPNLIQNRMGFHALFAKSSNRKLAIKLFKETKNGYKVEEKSGLNIWNAAGRKRHPDEVYIPFNIKDRNRPENKDFFPPAEENFELILPDSKIISAKVCQQDGKAIMSNPNRDLGKWLLRDVLELPEKTIVTYELLQQKGFDTVIFEKLEDHKFKIDFTDSKDYDDLYNESQPE